MENLNVSSSCSKLACQNIANIEYYCIGRTRKYILLEGNVDAHLRNVSECGRDATCRPSRVRSCWLSRLPFVCLPLAACHKHCGCSRPHITRGGWCVVGAPAKYSCTLCSIWTRCPSPLTLRARRMLHGARCLRWVREAILAK